MSSKKRAKTPPSPPASKRSPSTPISPTSNSFKWLAPIGLNRTLLHATYDDPPVSDKIACFDFVGTLIEPKSKGRYCQGEDDWKWLEKRKKGQVVGEEGERDMKTNQDVPPVVVKLRELYTDGYSIVIFSATRPIPPYLDEYRNIVRSACIELDVPLHVFISTDYDIYRMPCVGMFIEFEKNWNGKRKINSKESFFVGHADGTTILDYGRKFAMNLSIRIYPPREYFLDEKQETKPTLHGWNPSKFDHSGSFFAPTSTPLIPRRQSEFDDEIADVVFLVGPPASGKSSLYFRYLQKRGYERITSSEVDKLATKLRSNPKQLLYVLDFPLPSRASRSGFIKLLESHKPSGLSFKLRCFQFLVSEEVCKHNSQFAELWDQQVTPEGKERRFTDEEQFTDWRIEFENPNLNEGFREIKEISFKFDSTWPTNEIGEKRLKNWEKFGECYKKDYRTMK
ncbi:hypothetical protein JCM5353_005329 [Sporobolomyces roseus]